MAFRVSVELNPEGAVKGASEVKRSLTDLDRAADATERQVKELESQVKLLSIAEKEGAKAAAQFAAVQRLGGTATESQINRTRQLSGELFELNKRVGNASGEVRQLGSQVSDFFIQIQGGVNPLIAITQQGGQIVQAFNPAIGALFTIAGVLGTALLPQLFKSTSAMEDLVKVGELLDTTLAKAGDGTYILTQRITDLAAVSKSAARIQLATSILEARSAIEKAGKASKDAAENIDIFANSQLALLATSKNFKETLNTVGALTSATGLFAKGLGITETEAEKVVKQLSEFQRTKSPETIQALATQLSNLAISADKPNKKLVDFAGQINNVAVAVLSAAEKQKVMEGLLKNFDTALETNTSQARDNQSVIKGLAEEYATLGVEIAYGERAAAQYAAQLAIGTKATKEEIAQARSLAGLIFDKRKAQEDAKKAEEDAAAASKKAAETAKAAAKAVADEEKRRQGVIKELSDALAVNTLAVADNKREAEQLAAIQKLGNGATAEQVARVKELSGALYDQASAQQAVKDAEKLQKEVNRVEFDTLSPIQQLESQEAEKLAILNKYALLGEEQRIESERLITAVAEQGAKDRVELSRLEANNTLSATSSGLSALSQIAEQFAGDQDNRNKTAFALSKAFAISSAGLNLALAISQALADPTAITLPQKIANYAAIGTAGAGLLGTITNANYATGGYITGAGSGTSDDVPINASNGEFMINARATARNRGALETINRTGGLPQSTSGVSITVINNAPTDVTTTTDDSGNITLQIDERINQRVPQLMAGEVGNPNSKFNQTFKRQYQAPRR